MYIASVKQHSNIWNYLHTKNNYIAATTLCFLRSSFLPHWKMCMLLFFFRHYLPWSLWYFKYDRVALEWYQPAPSLPLGATCQVPRIAVCPVHFSASLVHPLLQVMLHFLRLHCQAKELSGLGANEKKKKVAEKWPDFGWNRVYFLHSTKCGAMDWIGFVFVLEKKLVIQGCITYCWAVLRDSQPFMLLMLPHQAGGAQGAGRAHSKLALGFVQPHTVALAHHSSLRRTLYRAFLPSSRSTFLPILVSSENWLEMGSFFPFFTQIQSEALGDHKLSKDKLQHCALVFSLCYKFTSNQPKFSPVGLRVSICTSVCRKKIH